MRLLGNLDSVTFIDVILGFVQPREIAFELSVWARFNNSTNYLMEIVYLVPDE